MIAHCSSRHLTPIATAVLGMFGLTATCFAQPSGLTLKPVTVTGSRAEASSFEQPFSIDVVGAEAVRQGQLGVNASESLVAVPGLVIQNRQNYAQDLQISSRGFGARSAFGVRGVKLIADGIPASTPDGQGQVATFNLDMAERIEVLRGPFSSVYGNSSGGVIQLFTRDGEGPTKLSGRLIGGSFSTSKIELGAEGALGSGGFLIDASRFDTDGYREHSAATRDQGFAKITLRPDADSKLTLVANGLRQDDTEDPLGLTWETFQTDPAGVEDRALEFDTRKDIEHVQGGMNYERRIGSGQLQFSAYAGTRSVMQVLAIPAFVQGSPTHSGGIVDFDRNFYGVAARWIQEVAIGQGKLTVTAGADYDRSEDDRQGYENFVGDTLGVRGALRRDETDTVTSLDPYVQLAWQRGPLTLQAGLRHSHVKFEVDDDFLSNGDDGGSVSYRKTTPAIGIAYAVSPAVNVYASAARGFETPTLGELSYSGGDGSFGFDLEAARSTQFEVGAKALVGEATRINVAAFRIRTKDELVVASSLGGRTAYQNAAETLREGIELAVDSELSRTLFTRAAVTQLRAIYDEGFSSGGDTIEEGRRMPGIPRTTVFAELAWKPGGDLTAAVEGFYRSKVFVEDSNTEQSAPSYAILNLRLSAEQRRGDWRIEQLLRVDNVFDRQYVGSVIVGDRNGRFYEPGTGVAWYAGIGARYQFN
ncbi:MAG: TonB-dependent receptor [Zoogloeaceae bacterium]|nr:TonB-dependent receptor [Rhodocyclaceae bacterium]MCP5236407.1 TonB-dependent receptor [Zoogloeaceae bacterium]